MTSQNTNLHLSARFPRRGGPVMSVPDWLDEDAGDFVPLDDALASSVLGLVDDWSGIVNRDPDLSALHYSVYLRSDHWRRQRELKLLRAGGVCQQCHAFADRLDVHHLTYARLGRELESDLIALCRPCHAAAHGRHLP